MTVQELIALAPHLTLTGGLLVLLLVIAFRRGARLCLILTVAILGLALAAVPISQSALSLPPGAAGFMPAEPGVFRSNAPDAQSLRALFRVDALASFFNSLFLLAALAVALLAHPWLKRRPGDSEEFCILLLTATIGAMFLASAQHFAGVLLGLEILAVSLYVLVAWSEESQSALEAGVKYLVLSGIGSATLLFGMALLYHATGALDFTGVGSYLPLLDPGASYWYAAGLALLLLGVAFKLSLMPLHMWTPDVYQGAPAPVAGFLATVSKVAVLAMLLRLAAVSEIVAAPVAFILLAVMAILSMVGGNLLALRQNNIKRLLACSSIAHAGYLVIPLLAFAALPAATAPLAFETALVSVAGYLLMTLAAFAVVGEMSADTGDTDLEQIDDYAGLFWRRPLLAGVLTVALLSLAGVPLTAGFIAKFYLFNAGIEGGLWGLVWALIIGSAISIYIYLKIVFAMTRRDRTMRVTSRSQLATGVALAIGLAVLAVGVWPAPLIDMAQGIAHELLAVNPWR